jgi:hypothetical protein
VNFEYLLDREYTSITLKVLDLSGKLWMELSGCPADNGLNSFTWRNSAMPNGNYVYRIIGRDNAGTESLLYTGRLTKVAR